MRGLGLWFDLYPWASEHLDLLPFDYFLELLFNYDYYYLTITLGLDDGHMF